jgi:parvulin-like peptidyl-prolyl isomerase
VTDLSARRAAISVLAVVAMTACASPGNDVAATIGDAEIGVAQLETRAAAYRAIGELAGQPCGAAEEGETAASACNRFALSQLVQTAISAGYAEEQGIRVDPQEVEDAVTGFENGVGSQEMSRALAAEGVARSDVLALVQDVLLTRAVGAAVVEEEVGDDALREAYQDDIARFTTVQAAHILVTTEAEADRVYRQVTAAGASTDTFARLARRESLDAESGRSGGVLGSAVASTYVPEFADAVAALEPGEISRPVQTEFGWHVLRLDASQVTPYEEAKDQLVQQIGGDRYQRWLQGRAVELEVDVNPRFGRLDPDTVTVSRVSSTSVDDEPSPSGEAVAPVSP